MAEIIVNNSTSGLILHYLPNVSNKQETHFLNKITFEGDHHSHPDYTPSPGTTDPKPNPHANKYVCDLLCIIIAQSDFRPVPLFESSCRSEVPRPHFHIFYTTIEIVFNKKIFLFVLSYVAMFLLLYFKCNVLIKKMCLL